MFKNKKKESIREYTYTDWEKDLGFLYLIMSKKKNITKEFLINTQSIQRTGTDYLKDEDIEPIIINCVETTISSLGENYKSFLINKYFGNSDNLVSFITEDVYVDLTADTINRNNARIKSNLQEKAISRITDLGKDKG